MRGDLPSAREHFIRALGIWQRQVTDSDFIPTAYDNLGEVASRQGDLVSAMDYHLQALRIREARAPLSAEAAQSLSCLGATSFSRNDLEAAKDYYRRALTIYESVVPYALETASCLEGMGRVDLSQNRPLEALPRFQKSVEIIERYRTQIAAPEARALLLAEHHRKYVGLIEAYLAVGDITAAFHTLERARSRSFAELLAARGLDTTDAPPKLLAEQQDLDRLRTQTYHQLSSLSGADSDAGKVEALHRTLRELERRQQDLTANIRAASPRYAALQYPQPLTLEAAQAALEPGTLLLSYLVDEEQTYLFAVTDTQAEAHVLPVGRVELAQRVREFRQATDRRRLEHDPAQEAAQARALYGLLVGPVGSAPRTAERLLLCPDGPLHSLPFTALVTNVRGKPKHLGAEKPVGQVLSMTIHAQSRAARPTPRALPIAPRLLAFGDPVYERVWSGSEAGVATGNELSLLQTRGLMLAPLPHSREEVEGLARMFGDAATVRLGAQATKAAVFSEAGDADLLHLACHAWFDPQVPLSSGLVLSQSGTDGGGDANGDNGLLQAWEVFQSLRLSADLVVLSACQTGLGQEVRGEGLVGLTRAFQYAGARSLVVTLWDVGDASTSVFMQAFYAALRDGSAKDEALRQGIHALRSDRRWDAPCYWAAFVLIGDRD
jgi:CHAT domain-containing protein